MLSGYVRQRISKSVPHISFFRTVAYSTKSEGKSDVDSKDSHVLAVNNRYEQSSSVAPLPWKDPWYYARGGKHHQGETSTSCEVEESTVEWPWIERLMPLSKIPHPPRHTQYPTPSGWTPPLNPPLDLPYRVRRTRFHLFPLYLECRRDQLDEKTFEFNYVELVILRNVEGDVFACERDLREYLEGRLNHKIATHVNEPQGKIRVRGADRSLLEQFLLSKGF